MQRSREKISMTQKPKSRREILKTAAAFSAAASFARSGTTAAIAATAVNKEALRGIDQDLRQAAETKDVAGVVAMAATDDGILYQGAFGKRDLVKGSDMTLDSVFWIASMTKAITSAAAMQLVEQGKLQLEQPMGWFPTFQHPRSWRVSTTRATR